MKVAVVGAGLAGICATKYCLDYGFEVTTFEKTNSIGGTWVFSPNVDKDEFGLDVHSSMYENLRSNFPKEIMGFPDYEFTGPEQSYVSSSEVLDFIKTFAQKFHVLDQVKFRHEIVRIRPIDRATTLKWEVMVRDLVNRSVETEFFDAIMCCNGHYSCPRIPDFPGRDVYRGKVIHTHSYRTPEIFKGETVLVIGSGASGIDVAYFASKVANKATISYHDAARTIPNGIYKKPDVKAFTETGVIFDDGSEEEFSVIVLATGYLYSFPFLSMDCGITIDDNFIQPLFKHCINIKYPTMCFIGMPYLVHPPLISYLQIQLFLKYLSGKASIPSKEEMLENTNREMESRWKNGFKKKQAHTLGLDFLGDYYADVCQLAGLPTVKPYMIKIYRENQKDMKCDPIRFREIKFTIVDDEHFEKTLPS